MDVIGKITLEVPAGRPAECPVIVTYSYDENQRVHAHVLDEASGIQQEVSVTFEGAGVLSEDAIARKSAYLKLIAIA